MPPDRLIIMANQIAQFFEAQPDRTTAVAGIAEHLQKFWEPRMRTQLRGLAQQSDCGLNPMVLEALPLLKPVANL